MPAYDGGDPVTGHGKVDCYRFMTFYPEPDARNTEDLFAKVVDPIWLAQDGSPNAVAMRQAQQPGRMPPSWRLLHRVTFVSRTLPPVPPSDAPPHEHAAAAVGLSSNWELVREIAPSIAPGTVDVASLEEQVRAAVSARLPELVGHEPEVTRVLAAFLHIDLD